MDRSTMRIICIHISDTDYIKMENYATECINVYYVSSVHRFNI